MPDLFRYRYRVLAIDLTSGQTDLEFQVEGQRIYYNGPSDGPELSIRLQERNADQITLRPQGEIVAPFTRIWVTGSASALTPQLIISAPASILVQSRDVNVGTINTLTSITDPVTVQGSLTTLGTITNPVITKSLDLDRALNARLYERGGSVANVAAVYNHHQIFNPVASGRTVVVRGIEFAQSAAGDFAIYQYNTALATLVGNLYPLDSGATAGVAQLRTSQPGATVGTNLLTRSSAPANTRNYFERFDVLGEGEGLLIVTLQVNLTTYYGFRVYEF